MRTSLALRLSISLFCASTLLAAAGGAAAQPVDAATRATARQVAEEGMRLYDRGDWAGAFEKLNRAHDLVHAPTMALYAGRCLEKLGRYVEASEKYLEATRDVVEPGAPPAQRTAQVEAERVRVALLPRIPAVELQLEQPAPDAVVTLDGKVVPAAMIGIRRPIDPGSHQVEVRRGPSVGSKVFSIREGESLRVVLPVPAGQGSSGFIAPPGGPGQPGVVLQQVYPPPDTPPRVMYRRRSTGLFVGGLVLAPVGGVTMLVGAAVAALQGRYGGSGTGLGVLGVGALMTAGGITMAVIGGKKVPVTTVDALIGPTGGSVRVTF